MFWVEVFVEGSGFRVLGFHAPMCQLRLGVWGGGRTSGSFRKLVVPYFGVLIIRILLFRVLYLGPYFRKLPSPLVDSMLDSQPGA